MGGVDKSRLLASGRAFIDRQLDVLRPLAADLMLIDRDAGHTPPPGVRVVADLTPGAGALGGIYTALQASTNDLVVIVACDMPFVTADLIACLLDHAADADVVIPRDSRGRHALCGVFHRRVAPILRTLIDAGQLRVEQALETLAVHEIGQQTLAALDRDGHLLVNVNTPEDYRDALGGYDTP